MVHRVVWFDIPVVKLERAMAFYENVLAVELHADVSREEFAVFSHSQYDVAGCLVRNADERPSRGGPLLYFNVSGRLDEAIELVEEYNGKLLKPRHRIGRFGYRAIVLDSEGNRIALHSA